MKTKEGVKKLIATMGVLIIILVQWCVYFALLYGGYELVKLVSGDYALLVYVGILATWQTLTSLSKMGEKVEDK